MQYLEQFYFGFYLGENIELVKNSKGDLESVNYFYMILFGQTFEDYNSNSTSDKNTRKNITQMLLDIVTYISLRPTNVN